jgi:adenylate cyclase
MRRLGLRRQSIVLVAIMIVVLLVISILGWLDGVELSAVNRAFQVRGPRPPSSPVIIVAIDDSTFANTGLQWPWPRTYFAQMVDRLTAGGAKVIAFDVFLSDAEDLSKPATYTVRGERLVDIAARYSVSVDDVRTVNGLDASGKVCGGQTLAIPTAPPVEHVVELDTVADLAARYRVDAKTLMRWNKLQDPCDLYPQQLLLIPVTGSVDYVVKDGDTVEAIASLYQVNHLALVNGDQPARDPLTPGQTLTVQFGDAALAASIRAAGNVVLNGEIARGKDKGNYVETRHQPLPILLDAAAGFGITSVDADEDGAAHSIRAWDTSQGDTYYSWPVVAAALYQGVSLDPKPAGNGFIFGRQPVPVDTLPTSLDMKTYFGVSHFSNLRINFRGRQDAIPTFSALQVVNGDLGLETFKDKIVFIGATSQSLHDIYATPFTPQNPPGMPGVEIMANALDTLLTGDFIYLRSGVCSGDTLCPIAFRAPFLLSIFLSGLLGLLLTAIRRTSLAIAALVSLLLLGIIVWLAAFIGLHTEIPLVAPEVSLFLCFVVPSLERAVSEELEKRRVRSIFELFISPEMVGQLIEQGIDAMRGTRAELTILFSDIRGFTTMSEKMTPEELVVLLNEYLGAMTDVIHRNGGTVDKYEGDLVMAFFGAPIAHPDHAQRALRTAIEMRQALDRLRAKWATEGKPSRLEMGIGLNTGEVFVGLIGSGRRVNYTVMGDVVNLASRLQDLTKELQWPLLISEFTYDKIKDEFDTEFAESRLVKGKTVPVGIYKVLGRRGAPEGERLRALYA